MVQRAVVFISLTVSFINPIQQSLLYILKRHSAFQYHCGMEIVFFLFVTSLSQVLSVCKEVVPSSMAGLKSIWEECGGLSAAMTGVMKTLQ